MPPITREDNALQDDRHIRAWLIENEAKDRTWPFSNKSGFVKHIKDAEVPNPLK